MNKYLEIENALRSEFSSGKFINAPFPSEHMLMKRFGVARGTIRQALARLEADGLIVRRRGSGTDARQRTNPATGRLGLLIPDMAANLFFRLTTSELVRCGQECGYVILLGECAVEDNITARRRNLLRFIDQFISQRVEGVIFRPFIDERLHAANQTAANRLRKAGIPLVLIDSDLSHSPSRSNFDLVGINHVNAGRSAAEALMAAGRRNIHFLMPQSCTVTRDRVFGASGSIIAAGMEWNDSHMLCFAPDDAESLKRLFGEKRRPDGIICGADCDAAILIKSLARLGFSVPKDISVTGCDDTPEASNSTPTITTFSQPIQLIAKTAIEVLQKRIRNPLTPPRAVLLDAPIVRRDSL
jgi:LacI family transcriptional regulator